MTAGATSVGDSVLRWASEVGSGSWAWFTDAVASCGAKAPAGPAKAWIVASQLSSLGHLDIDWTEREWSVAAPCLALPRGLGMCAFLAGWRTSDLVGRMRRALDQRVDLYMFVRPQGHASSAIFVKAQAADRLADLAEELHIKVVYDPARATSPTSWRTSSRRKCR